MIALALLLAAAQDAPIPPPEDDIIIVGERLKALSVIVGKDDRGRFTCRLSRSSGSSTLDGQLCRAASTCVANGAKDSAAVGRCIDKRKPELLADLRRAREASGK